MEQHWDTFVSMTHAPSTGSAIADHRWQDTWLHHRRHDTWRHHRRHETWLHHRCYTTDDMTRGDTTDMTRGDAMGHTVAPGYVCDHGGRHSGPAGMAQERLAVLSTRRCCQVGTTSCWRFSSTHRSGCRHLTRQDAPAMRHTTMRHRTRAMRRNHPPAFHRRNTAAPTDRSDSIRFAPPHPHARKRLYPQRALVVALATAGPPTQSGHCARAPTQRCAAQRNAVAQYTVPAALSGLPFDAVCCTALPELRLQA
jgi:hypothetical protein